MHGPARTVLAILLAMAALVGAAAESTGQPAESPATAGDPATLITELASRGRIPGIQAALIEDGEIAWVEGAGTGRMGSLDPVTAASVFEAASLTKPLFAYAVMRLIEEDLLDYDTRLVDILPTEALEQQLGHSIDREGFRRDWLELITVAHLLSHSAGTPHGPHGEIYPIAFEPGTRYSYSAGGYYLLQLAIEHLEGQPLEAIIDAYVLEPLEMRSSSMVWRESYESTAVSGHDMFGAPQDLRRRTRAHAAASLYTTAADYARFVAAFMNREGLKLKSLKGLLRETVDVDPDRGLSWGIGFGRQQDDNGLVFWQWGDFGIFRNFVIADPRNKTALIYLTNSENGLSICKDLVQQAMGITASGIDYLGYAQHDSLEYELAWAIDQAEPEAIPSLVERLSDVHPVEAVGAVLPVTGFRMLQYGKAAKAVALLGVDVARRPDSGDARGLLAQAMLRHGDFDGARSEYAKALELGGDRVHPEAVSWSLDYIRALQSPMRLSPAFLARLAGQYETRSIELADGRLYYFRSDSALGQRYPLVPLSAEVFMLEGMTNFRLRFDYDEQGLPTAVSGLYEGGGSDTSVRTPEVTAAP